MKNSQKLKNLDFDNIENTDSNPDKPQSQDHDTDVANFKFLFTEKYIFQVTLLIHFISLLLKALTGLYGYSGEHDPPKFGDYEAQRHWMELTTNLPVSEWYTDSENNPKEYWPLDYPPLSGYYSLLWGYFFKFILPKSVLLKLSWGFESQIHKFLMRFSVLASDFLFYHIPVYLLCSKLFLSKNYNFKCIQKYYISSILFLCSPVLIVIDHGHFQYNCVMHGLFILTLYFLYCKFFILAIFTYCLCINFKQMGLYFALPLPFFVLKCLFEETKQRKNKHFTFYYLILNTFKYGLYTALSFAIIWGPWITSHKYSNVVRRIFPIWRGIFEDKVASFWCTLNMIKKINKLPHEQLIFLSFAFTAFPSFISSISILWLRKPSIKLTNLCFFIVSMSFFFFSFHVHEKTILVPFLAYVLNYHSLYFILPSFSLVSLFSLYPLLKREDQHIPYFIFLIFSFIFNKYLKSSSESLSIKAKESKLLTLFFNLLDILNVLFIIVYHTADIIIPPPQAYPWIYPALNAAFSFGNFMLFYMVAIKKLFDLQMKKGRLYQVEPGANKTNETSKKNN